MSGIIRPIITQPVKHIYKMLSNREYFIYNLLWSKLRRVNRYEEINLKLYHWHLLIPDTLSFLYMYRDIFVNKIYQFNFESQTPKILDLGANIGLSILFFKSIYPQAKITAFEADPKIFSYLEKNVHGNNYLDVELINKAVWHENAILDFFSEGADAGYIKSDNESEGNLKIEAIDIAEILKNNKFDFIKMDIEGAEEFVVPRLTNLLQEVKFIFIEYHSRINCQQSLDNILKVLKENEFRISIYDLTNNLSPFTNLNIRDGFDLQLNIFGWKSK